MSRFFFKIFFASIFLFSIDNQTFGQNSDEVPEQNQNIKKQVKLKKQKVPRKILKNARDGYFTEDHKIIEENLKNRRKQHQKWRKNPNLIDPLSFGHQRLPNKKTKKREYCTTCQIVH